MLKFFSRIEASAPHDVQTRVPDTLLLLLLGLGQVPWDKGTFTQLYDVMATPIALAKAGKTKRQIECI
jgi:hypothetical protein